MNQQQIEKALLLLTTRVDEQDTLIAEQKETIERLNAGIASAKLRGDLDSWFEQGSRAGRAFANSPTRSGKSLRAELLEGYFKPGTVMMVDPARDDRVDALNLSMRSFTDKLSIRGKKADLIIMDDVTA